MKKLFRIALVAGCMLLVGNVASAQQKIAHINSADLIKAMPEVANADKKLEEYKGTLDNDGKTMYTEYQSKVQDYQSKEKTLSDAMKEVKIKEIQDLEKRIQEFQQKASEDFERKRGELYDPILKKAEDAVKAVAKEKGYAYVLDITQPGVVYFDGGINILGDVKAKLGLK
ncbi:outer membrane chaperone Skp (OmpH) [Pseudopedobacter saltans DSM 12145]|uniref:Outer membrane chaperone Skp (OmpH) n=1 Tax=Pseudopedobacter saltans (strain ATCC 51119 / DSM 12145 / JCM 21818 / CCUG 39354 / LMG 10337 / NBRC 100064 / NCIMB 13643) TaxID=762903 RepID=F0S9U8_PSESL|nr:OmpH family outer membrane protein [Pseudopedobacter saltans]ADY52506.1 outer membrane chaperone Skp (OmpH) [Pseudopedobacter saltans DSM 12145]